MRIHRLLIAGVPTALLTASAAARAQTSQSFTIEQVLSYPYPTDLVAAPSGARVAWVIDKRGVRNVWGAEGPAFAARRLTEYSQDDGQELTNLSFTHDGQTIVYTRGGDHDSNWPAEGGLAPDPDASASQPKIQIWSASFAGGAPRLLADGDDPAISPRGDVVAFIRDHRIWSVPLDGSKPAVMLAFDRGNASGLAWSPTGDALAFVSTRSDHSFIGVYTSDSAPVRYLAPSTSRDGDPAWSPDGREIAFIRRPGAGGAPQTLLDRHPIPWAIWVAEVATGTGRAVWTSPATLRGSISQVGDGPHLAWLAGGRLLYRGEIDGWPHLYSVQPTDGQPTRLTTGTFMVEDVAQSPGGSFVVYGANTGRDSSDDDRRHLYRVGTNQAPVALTTGDGIEWNPVVTGDGKTIAFFAAGPRMPPLVSVLPSDGGAPRSLTPNEIPADFPTAQLVVPRRVVFRSEDGLLIHGQLFERPGGSKTKPALIFVHGGPPRQMLLGWHYMDYYAGSYAMNQYYANHGYVVLSVNYRLGIGYGHEFHYAENAGPFGASEYRDVLAGRAFLATLPQVDSAHVGIWGGSYGGFLTALALARNSNLFAAGVDLHGVHSWVSDDAARFAPLQQRFERADIDRAMQVAWESSPVASVSTWRSPVLLIQGDDDRNVHFSEMVDLVQRLTAASVPYQQLVLPNEIHGFLRFQSWLTADNAAVRFFDTTLKGEKSGETAGR
jgi:dipeptidyl aminopeptidase/acylaminoacyl peptidase